MVTRAPASARPPDVSRISTVLAFLRRHGLRLLFSKRPFQLTSAGWVFILYTVGVGAGAINTGNNLLYLIFGVFLGVILASGVLSDMCLWGLRVSWEFPPNAEALRSCFLPFVIHNTKRFFPSISVAAEIQGTLRQEAVTLRALVPSIHAGKTQHDQWVFTPSQRGLFCVSRIRASTRFPFGLLNKWWVIETFGHDDPQATFVVYPALLPVAEEDLRSSLEGMASAAQVDKKGDGTAIFGLRDYRETDNPRRIHWKSSAKRAPVNEGGDPSWLVRELEAERNEEALLLWPAEAELASLSLEQFEIFVRYAASVYVSLGKAGVRGRLIANIGAGEWVELGADAIFSADPLLEFLALVEKSHLRAALAGGEPFFTRHNENNAAFDLLRHARAEMGRER